MCINAAFGEFPGLAGVMFPIFAKIIAVVHIPQTYWLVYQKIMKEQKN